MSSPRRARGYAPAEASADKYHGVVKFDVITGKQSKRSPTRRNTPRCSPRLLAEAEADRRSWPSPQRIAVGHRPRQVRRAIPERTFDVAIAEQHGVTFAAGLATEGFKPFTAIYSTFLQRAFDQVVHDVALQKLPVRFPSIAPGWSAPTAPPMPGSFAWLSRQPAGLRGDGRRRRARADAMVATAAADRRPSLGLSLSARRGGSASNCRPRERRWRSARAGSCAEGTKIAILNFGARLQECWWRRRISGQGLSTTVADARFAKPLDTD